MSHYNISGAFPGWETDGILGSGAFGTVYLAHTLVDEKPVYAAVKVIKTPPSEDSVANAESMGIGRDLLKTYFGKFKNELNWELTMFKTVSSQHLVNVDTVAMEDLPGAGWVGYIRSAVYTPLDVYFEASPATQEDAVRLGVEISSALMSLGEYGMIHGEVKPENILVSDNGTFLLSDYGVRRCLEKAGTGLFGLEASPYDAPEIGEERNYSVLTDIYALGMLICCAANGMKLPENGDPDNIAGIDPKLCEIIKKAAAKNPEERYQTPTEVYNELTKLTLYTKRRPQRRAIAAATAFELVKKNGGTIKSPTAPAKETKPAESKPITPDDAFKKAFGEPAGEKSTGKSNKALAIGIAAIAVLAAILLFVLNRCSAGEPGDDTPDNPDMPNVSDNINDGDGETTPLDTEKLPDEGKDAENNTDDGSVTAPEDGDGTEPGEDENKDDTQGSGSQNTDQPDTTTPSGTTGNGTGTNPGTQTNPTTPVTPANPTVPATPAKTNTWVFSDSDTVLITRDDLEGMSRDESYTAINEIYARHGKIFTDSAVQKYFEGQSWYTGTTKSSDTVVSKLNETEKANIRTIVDYQREMGYREGGTTSAETAEPTTETQEKPDETPTEEPDMPTEPAPEPPADPENPDETEPVAEPETDYILPTDTALITREDLEGYTREQSYMAINEIYARHGKIFGDSKIQSYFEGKAWYTPVTEDSSEVTPLFTELEKTNLHVLTAYQKEMGFR